MDTETILEHVRMMAGPLLAASGVEVVEVICGREGHGRVLRFVVDKPGGVTLDDCAQLNRSLGELLDASDVELADYLLEVASPGLDRPLRTRRDFDRVHGERVEVNCRERINGRGAFVGLVQATEDDAVVLETKQYGRVTIPLTNITQAKRQLQW